MHKIANSFYATCYLEFQTFFVSARKFDNSINLITHKLPINYTHQHTHTHTHYYLGSTDSKHTLTHLVPSQQPAKFANMNYSLQAFPKRKQSCHQIFIIRNSPVYSHASCLFAVSLEK